MSNPTELPDLDKLEALARTATPGEWKAMPYGRVVGGPLRHYVNGSAPAQIASFGVTFHEQAPEDEPERQQANAEFAAAVNPEQVLALIALARRAQPEGEAPQAEPVTKVVCPGCNGIGTWIGQHDGYDDADCHMCDGTGKVAATLSPLCGDQHAESGKEASTMQSVIALLLEIENCPDDGEPWVIAGKARLMLEALAAQQAAAPGPKLMSYDEFFAEARRLGCKLPADVCAALVAAPDYSAPGTPEAPKGSIGDLTEFHGLLNWYDNEASYGSINEGRNKLTEYIDKWASKRAAQLDGGQEGSESNG